MKLIFLFIICVTFSVYSQVPTTLSEIYKGKINLDFSRSERRVVGKWEERQSMPYPRYYGASVLYSSGDTTWLYVFGGDTTSRDAITTCLRYNVETDSWEYIAPLPIPMRVNSAVRLGEKLYTMGGLDTSATAVKKFYEYDVNNNLWSEMPELPDAIFLHKAIPYQDSLIYIIGGVKFDSTIFLSRILLFNVNTHEFRDATPLPEPRANFAAVLLNDSIFITGGYFNNDSLSNKTIIAAINPIDHAQLTYYISADSISNYPVSVHSHFGYPENKNRINFYGGSKSTRFSPTNESYSLSIPAVEYDTIATISDSLTAFYSGYNFHSINPGGDSVLIVVISGGVTTGPTITGVTWIYRDTLFVTGIVETNPEIPSGFSLSQNYPNPFNPSTKIEFKIPEQSFVKLEIFNLLGEKVAVLVSETLSADTYKYEWNTSSAAGGLTSGTYFYRLTARDFMETKKLLLLK